MSYYWIRKEDLKGQGVIDEVDIDDKVTFVKVKKLRGAVFYHEEVSDSVQKKELQAV